MAPVQYTFEQGAYNQITSHCVKHMSHDVFGVLIGSVDGNMIESAIPKTHSIVGSYYICAKGTHQPLPGGPAILAAKLKANAPRDTGAAFTVDAEKLSKCEFSLHSLAVKESDIKLSEDVMKKALNCIRDKSYLAFHDFDEFFHDPSLDSLAGLKYIK